MYFSVLILTLNEEINLPGCIESVRPCDDIILLDSFSHDRTEEIAKAMGCTFIRREFDNYASQRNFGMNQIQFKHQWVMMLDADERITPELWHELNTLLPNLNSDVCMLRVRRKDLFCGKWIKHSSGYPTWFGRVFRPGLVTVKRAINEEYHTNGQTAYLQEHLIHFPFNKGMSFWIERHNRYSTLEAATLIQEIREDFNLTQIFSSNPVKRRKAYKQLAYRLPARPLLVFLYLCFFRKGFMDGKAGLFYCILRSFYEYMIDMKVLELRRRNNGLLV